MDNTYQQAADKLGITKHAIKKWVARRRIAVIVYGHRTRRIADEEIERFRLRRTVKAIV